MQQQYKCLRGFVLLAINQVTYPIRWFSNYAYFIVPLYYFERLGRAIFMYHTFITYSSLSQELYKLWLSSTCIWPNVVGCPSKDKCWLFYKPTQKARNNDFMQCILHHGWYPRITIKLDSMKFISTYIILNAKSHIVWAYFYFDATSIFPTSRIKKTLHLAAHSF